MTPGPYVKEALISSGKDASIEKGDVVLYNNMLLGRVVEVYDNFSKILLIFDSRSKISAITEATGNKILLEGNNTNKLSIRYLLNREHVQDLEFVKTSNYCSLFPPGIRIGLIKRKNNSVYIQAPYKNTDIRYVQVIRHNF
jgi:rod shape-determining protein MreC